MPRVPVPDDYPSDHIVVAGTDDYHYREADVQVDAPRARSLQIREDENGRYCGPPEQFADAVRAHLGLETGERVESSATVADDVTALIDAGECPWCDDYAGDAVPQHASSAHPDEWQAHKAE